MATSEVSQIEAVQREWYLNLVLDDQSADETTSDEIDVRNVKAVTLAVETGAGVSGGVVTLEGAVRAGYTGTWQSLGTVTAAAASQLYILTISHDDAQGLPLRVVRARISTVITGGNVDVYIARQK